MPLARPGLLRRLLLPAVLAVPLAVDPALADVLAAKGLWLALLGGALLLLLAVELLIGRRSPLVATPAEVVLVLLLLWSTVSLVWAVNPALASLRVLMLAGLLGAARTWRETVPDTATARRWIVALVGVGLAAVLIDVALVRQAARPLDADAAKYASILFVHDNIAASFVTMLVPLLVALACGARRKVGVVAPLVALALLVAYLVSLQSRAGLLGALLGALVVLLLFALRRRLQAGRCMPGRRGLALGALLVVVVSLAPLSAEVRGAAKSLFYRGVSVLGFSLQDVAFRPLLWRKTMALAEGRELLGVGAGNFAVEFPRVERLPVPKPHAHNDALHVYAETGLPGLMLFLGLLLCTGWLLLRSAGRTRERADFAVPAGLLASLCVFALVGSFEVPFAIGSTVAVLALLIGLAGGLGGPGPTAVSRRLTLARGLALAAVVALVPGLWTLLERLPASTLQARAEAAFVAGDLDRAEDLFRDVAGRRTGVYHPSERLAEISMLRGRGEEALQHRREARALWPWSAALMQAEGDTLMLLGRPAEAVELYRSAMAATPAADEAFFRLLLALDRDGQLASAVEIFEQRVREDSALALDSIVRLAESCRRLGLASDGDEAVLALVRARHWYAAAAQDDPARVPALDEAFRDVTHRLQLQPGAPDSWWAAYEDFRRRGGWGLPLPALRVGLRAEDRSLYPGWELPDEAPLPGAWRLR